MERLNSGDYKIIFGTILSNLNIGLMNSGRVQCQKAEETRKGFQYCTNPSGQEILFSELFKVVQDAVLLIFLYRTKFEFRTISSSTFIISDVQSIYTPSQIED